MKTAYNYIEWEDGREFIYDGIPDLSDETGYRLVENVQLEEVEEDFYLFRLYDRVYATAEYRGGEPFLTVFRVVATNAVVPPWHWIEAVKPGEELKFWFTDKHLERRDCLLDLMLSPEKAESEEEWRDLIDESCPSLKDAAKKEEAIQMILSELREHGYVKEGV